MAQPSGKMFSSRRQPNISSGFVGVSKLSASTQRTVQPSKRVRVQKTAANKNEEKKLKSVSKKLVIKYPERFYNSERYSPAEGGFESKAEAIHQIPLLKKYSAAVPRHPVTNSVPTSNEIVFKHRSASQSKSEVLISASVPTMKQLSLIEQKKLQWAKERDEMNGLWSPWGRPSTSIGPQHTGIVAREELNEISTKYLKQVLTSRQSPTISSPIMKRNSHHSLLNSNNNSEVYKSSYGMMDTTSTKSVTVPTFNYYNVEDDHTSGYQSDNCGGGGAGSRQPSGSRNQQPQQYRTNMDHHGGIPPEMSRSFSPYSNPAEFKQQPSAMRSSFTNGISDVGYIDQLRDQERAKWLRDLKSQMVEQNQRKDAEQRSRWGDKGICVGHFWEPDMLVPNSADSNPPAWADALHHEQQQQQHQHPGLSGGLGLSLSKSQPSLLDPNSYLSSYSPSAFGRHEQEQFVYTMNQSVGDLRNVSQKMPQPPVSAHSGTTFLRGQNVPIDPEELQEKEKKRLAAMQHQQAILQQIEERQRRIKEEREQRERQEAIDEQRIREQELKLLERAEKEKRLKLQQQQQMFEDGDEDGGVGGGRGDVQIFRMPPIATETVPIAVLNRRQQFRPQNSEDVINFQHVRNLASESVQTEAVEMLPKSPRCEIGIQTEPNSTKASPAKQKGGGPGPDEHSSSGDQKKVKHGPSTNSKPPPKPRWGAGEAKKPYKKQSEKDPLYQERMNRINSKRRNWLKDKAEEKVHAAAATASSGDSSVGRRFSESHAAAASSNRRSSDSREISKMVERQKRQWKQQQEVDAQEEEKNAAIVRRQSRYLDTLEIDSSQFTESSMEKVDRTKAQRRASMPVEGTQRSKERSASTSRKPGSKIQVQQELQATLKDSFDELETTPPLQLEPVVMKNESKPKVKPKKIHKPKPMKTESQPHKSRPRASPEVRRITVEENMYAVNPVNLPRSQSPPVPALMKHIQMGVDPEEFGHMEMAYEIPEKVGIDSTPPAPISAPAPIIPVVAVPVASLASSEETQAASSKDAENFSLVVQQEESSEQNSETEIEIPEPTNQQPVSEAEEEESLPEPQSPPAEFSPIDYVEEVDSSDYYANYIQPAISPSFGKYFLDTGPMSGRPSTRDSEFSQRRRLITTLMSRDEVQEQISAREDELSQNGIIEFSIHLPRRLHSSGSLMVATRFDGDSEEKVLHCSQPSSPAASAMEESKAVVSASGYKYDYQDPLDSARRRAATIRWLYASDRSESDPYILTRLSSLKRGIQQQQVEWSHSNAGSSVGSVAGPSPLHDYEYGNYESVHHSISRRHHQDSLLLEYEN